MEVAPIKIQNSKFNKQQATNNKQQQQATSNSKGGKREKQGQPTSIIIINIFNEKTNYIDTR